MAVAQVGEKVGKKLAGELLGMALDVVDIGLDAYEYQVSIADFKASFASSNDMKGLHEASAWPHPQWP